eukprot:TRINITY_DN71753_c0_g1_i1.p1 TRINITY_DN71753_c0_g1~~TRINITY_DN71753_c0_g1_i1.p1  ORF type:complete len:520 (+),score=87.50 TRINITY_DN71753_c0_g1_i1:79-1638(+)
MVADDGDGFASSDEGTDESLLNDKRAKRSRTCLKLCLACVGCLVLIGVAAVVAWKLFLAKAVCEGMDSEPWLAMVNLREASTRYRAFGEEVALIPTFPVPDGTHECRITATEKCPMDAMPSNSDQYTMVYPGGKTTCINTTAPYSFQVWPGDRDKLVIFFQGGGACWGKASTVYHVPGNLLPRGFCTQTVYVQNSAGAFNKSDERNAWQNYTVLHINYCSGDGHSGAMTQDYKVDDNGQCHHVRQYGYYNARAAIDWVKQHVDLKLTHLIVSGASAGSLGTQIWANQLFKEFGSDGRSFQHGAAVVDSYAGVFPKNTMTRTMKYRFNVCETGLLSGNAVKGCGHDSGKHDNELTMQNIWKDALTAHPHVAFAHINSKEDEVQIGFYKAIAASYSQWFQLTVGEYFKRVNLMFEEYNIFPNYVSFLVDGPQHTFMMQQDQENTGINNDSMPVCNYYWTDTTGKLGKGGAGPLLYRWVELFHKDLPTNPPATECDGGTLQDLPESTTDYCDVKQQPKNMSH